jgi:hypothetical protein
VRWNYRHRLHRADLAVNGVDVYEHLVERAAEAEKAMVDFCLSSAAG